MTIEKVDAAFCLAWWISPQLSVSHYQRVHYTHIGVTQIIHFNGMFHEIHHPFWGTPMTWTIPFLSFLPLQIFFKQGFGLGIVLWKHLLEGVLKGQVEGLGGEVAQAVGEVAIPEAIPGEPRARKSYRLGYKVSPIYTYKLLEVS